MSHELGKPAVCVETALDEAFLVGTREELSAFAHAILEALEGPAEPVVIAGIKAQSVSGALSEVMSEVVLDGMLIVDSKQSRQTLINFFRTNNGQEPIDWEGREKHLDER